MPGPDLSVSASLDAVELNRPSGHSIQYIVAAIGFGAAVGSIMAGALERPECPGWPVTVLFVEIERP